MALGFASTLAPQAYNPCMRRPAKFTVIGVATDVVSSKFFDHLPSSFSHRLHLPPISFQTKSIRSILRRIPLICFSPPSSLQIYRVSPVNLFLSLYPRVPFSSLAPFLGEHRDRGLRNPIRGSISRERRPRIGTSPNERRNLDSWKVLFLASPSVCHPLERFSSVLSRSNYGPRCLFRNEDLRGPIPAANLCR